MDFKFNANKMVKVKLTKKGEELLKRQQKEFYNVIGEENETIDLKLDENGYYETRVNWGCSKKDAIKGDVKKSMVYSIVAINKFK